MGLKVNFEEIEEDFEVYGININCNEEAKIKCLTLCENFNLTSEQLAVNWLGFAASNSFEEVNLDHLEAFEKELIKQRSFTQNRNKSNSDPDILNSSNALSTADNDLLAAYGASPAVTATSSATKTKNDASEGTPRQAGTRKSLNFSTHSMDEHLSPLAPSLTQSQTSLQQSQSYSSRTNSGAEVNSYGNNVGTSTWKADFSHSPEVNELPCGNERPLRDFYNFMFEKLRDCAEVLDYSIYTLGKEIFNSLKVEEMASLDSLSNEPTWYVGRICCDSVGRLNAASILLEGDRETSSGTAVRLDLSKLNSYSLFPGQVVAVKGFGTAGNCLIAQDIIAGNILPAPEFPLSLGNEGVQIRIACGPFTTLENLLYEPLMDLLQEIVTQPPHLLFLVGPLLEISHPSLDDPMLSDTYDSIYARCLSRITNALKSTRTKVYIVASQYDVCCTPIYPTPPVLTSGSLNGDNNIRFLPDPALLAIDGVCFGFTTVDYPMHMGREEISLSPSITDRLARLSQHILQQQSFYPIHPPPEGTSFNVEQADLHNRLPFTPHIIITPSDLKNYIKKVDGCLFINPGRLTKGRTGGCYCKLNVRELHNENEKEPEINVQILKI